MHIPFLPLADINRRYETQLQSVFSQKLQEGQFILGKSLTQFEEAFANYCGVQHCIGVGNGFDALYLIIKSLQLPPNSEIIVPANTFIAGLQRHRVVKNRLCYSEVHETNPHAGCK